MLEIDQSQGSQRVWIKVVTNNKQTIWHRCQHLASHILRLPILRSSVSIGGSAALSEEARRLVEVRAAGFNVPQVLALDDRVMVLSDMGPSMRTLLRDFRKSPAPERHFNDVQQMLLSAAKTLCALHAAGFVHGRPHVKDFTWSEGQAGLLDFEENPSLVMSWHEARARDAWLFLLSVAGHITQPHQREELLTLLLREFWSHFDEDSRNAKIQLVRAFKPLRQVVELFLVRPLALVGMTASRDVMQAVHASTVLERMCLGRRVNDDAAADLAA